MALPLSARRLRDLDFVEWRLTVEKMLQSLDDRIARVGGRSALVYPAGTAFLVGSAPPAGAPMIVKVNTVVVTVGAGSVVSFNYIDGPFPNGIVSVVTSPGDNTALDTVRQVVASSTLATFSGVATNYNGGVPAGTGVRINYVAYGW